MAVMWLGLSQLLLTSTNDVRRRLTQFFGAWMACDNDDAWMDFQMARESVCRVVYAPDSQVSQSGGYKAFMAVCVQNPIYGSRILGGTWSKIWSIDHAWRHMLLPFREQVFRFSLQEAVEHSCVVGFIKRRLDLHGFEMVGMTCQRD